MHAARPCDRSGSIGEFPDRGVWIAGRRPVECDGEAHRRRQERRPAQLVHLDERRRVEADRRRVREAISFYKGRSFPLERREGAEPGRDRDARRPLGLRRRQLERDRHADRAQTDRAVHFAGNRQLHQGAERSAGLLERGLHQLLRARLQYTHGRREGRADALGGLSRPEMEGENLHRQEDYPWYATLLAAWGKEKTEKYMRALAKQDIQWRKGHSLIAQLMGAGEFP